MAHLQQRLTQAIIHYARAGKVPVRLRLRPADAYMLYEFLPPTVDITSGSLRLFGLPVEVGGDASVLICAGDEACTLAGVFSAAPATPMTPRALPALTPTPFPQPVIRRRRRSNRRAQ